MFQACDLAFFAGTAWGLLHGPRGTVREPARIRAALHNGLRAARVTVESGAAVSPQLVPELLVE